MSTPSCHRPPLHAKFEPTRSARRLSVHRALSLSLLCLGGLATLAAGQEMTGFDRQRAHLMLRAAEQDLRDHYYDTTFHGLDLRTLFDSTDARIAAAHSNDEAFLSIAVTLGALRDSHTHFFPPRRNAVVQYGWNLGIVGAPATSSKCAPRTTPPRNGSSPATWCSASTSSPSTAPTAGTWSTSTTPSHPAPPCG